MPTELFTIGHSNRSIDGFTGLVSMHGIETICDVRSNPYSRFNPQFNRESFARHLRELGVEYIHLGVELGPRTDDPDCIVDGRVRYDLLAATERFRQGLDRLRGILIQSRTALVCAEKDPLFCHRAVLVCRKLRAGNLHIIHIIDEGIIEEHPAAERRLLDMLGIPPTDLFETEEEIIERAYDLQGARIAFSPEEANENVSKEDGEP